MGRKAYRSIGLALLGFIGAFSIAGLKGAAAEDNAAECVRDFEEGRDYFPDKIDLQYATGFSVAYHNHYKIMTIRSPTDPGVRDVLVLVQCGTPIPALEGDIADATVVKIPVQTIGANEDLSLNRARVLGFSNRVVAAGGDGIYSPDLRARVLSGTALKIGESFHGLPNYEQLLTASPDVVFLSTASLARAESIKRARAIDIAAAPSMSWVESTVLGQAEWLYQVAVFFNAEAKANELLRGVKDRYKSLSAQANARPDRPTIVWLDLAEQRDQWRVPDKNWIAQLIKDAGAQSPWASPSGPPTRTVTTEQILAEGIRARAFVTEHATLNASGKTVMETVKTVRDGNLYDVHRRSRPEHNAYDWYESAVVEVDAVLADLVAIVHPELLPNHEFRHLQPADQSTDGATENK